MAIIMQKILRCDDKKVFYIRTEQNGDKFLCSSTKRILKTLCAVRDLNVRFRSFIDGYD